MSDHLLTPEEAGMSYRKPLRDALAAAIFDASIPPGINATWAKLTGPSVSKHNLPTILRVYRQVDAVLAVIDAGAALADTGTLTDEEIANLPKPPGTPLSAP